jgi:hypothetical protein
MKKADWSDEMEAKFQLAFKPWPNHNASNEARAEFAKINPDDELLAKIRAAVLWQAAALQGRIARARSTVVVPQFRRWLHNRWWEELEVDGVGPPQQKPEEPPPCAICGMTEERHAVMEGHGISLAMAVAKCEEFREVQQ